MLVPVLDLVAAASTWYSPRKWVPSIVYGPCTARVVVLQVGAWAYLVAACEIFVHLLIAQADAAFGYEFWVALLVVIGIANLVPWLVVVLIWRAAIDDLGCLSSHWWALPQCALGFAKLLVLGGGFYLGPAAVIVDSFLRMVELVPTPPVQRRPEEKVALGLSDLSEL